MYLKIFWRVVGPLNAKGVWKTYRKMSYMYRVKIRENYYIEKLKKTEKVRIHTSSTYILFQYLYSLSYC